MCFGWINQGGGPARAESFLHESGICGGPWHKILLVELDFVVKDKSIY